MDYRPDLSNMITLILLTPTYDNKLGVNQKKFPTVAEALQDENNIFYGTFKTYGGTEKTVNGVYSISDTAIVETYFRPDIKSDCRVAREDGAVYDIINEPEDINQRHQFMKFKVQRVKGGA